MIISCLYVWCHFSKVRASLSKTFAFLTTQMLQKAMVIISMKKATWSLALDCPWFLPFPLLLLLGLKPQHKSNWNSGRSFLMEVMQQHFKLEKGLATMSTSHTVETSPFSPLYNICSWQWQKDQPHMPSSHLRHAPRQCVITRWSFQTSKLPGTHRWLPTGLYCCCNDHTLFTASSRAAIWRK